MSRRPDIGAGPFATKLCVTGECGATVAMLEQWHRVSSHSTHTARSSTGVLDRPERIADSRFI
jgi:hypothetical protein